MSQLSQDVDKDPAAARWLNGITRASTKRYYKTALRIYVGFTGKTPSELIDEALEDAKLDQRAKKDVVVGRLLAFYNWLRTEYPVRSRGNGKHVVVGKGVSERAASTYVNVIRSFYETFGITVKLKGRTRLPKGRVINKRLRISAEQVRVLLDHSRTPRDRAIILMIFQSGMDVSTLCSLKYRDVSAGLAKNEYPLVLDLYRPKTGVEYFTFLGKSAVEALKAYIKDCELRGITFAPDTPLFLKEKGKEALKPHNIMNMLREVAFKAGFISEAERKNPRFYNPLGPHALRESFSSIMINSGVPDTIVDFWLGHQIGDLSRAYKSVQFESLKKMYLERERLIDPYASSKHEIEEISRKTKSFEEVLASIMARNQALEERIKVLEEGFKEVLKEFKKIVEGGNID